jgi:hypothetical protein
MGIVRVLVKAVEMENGLETKENQIEGHLK